MSSELERYQKKKDFLVCVDSDGCAMDTMDAKHKLCFGPCMVEEWCLQQWREEVLTIWNQVNLYEMTRGINRFKGLSIVLTEVDRKIRPVEGIRELREWSEQSSSLSESGLAAALVGGGSVCMEKALCWSRAANQAIAALPETQKVPFPGAAEGVREAVEFADIAIISSANRAAVEEEWRRHGLMEYVDIAMTQEDGGKARCIARLVEKGYDPLHVLMVGDAPGDLSAAEKCGVFFFPVLARREVESWREFAEAALPALRSGAYGAYGGQKVAAFLKNLSISN